MDSIQIVPIQKSSHYKIFLWLLFIVALVVGGVFVWQQIQRAKIEKIKSTLPANLLSGSDGESVYKAEQSEDFILRPNETLAEEGISYKVAKPQKEVQSTIFQEVTRKGWVFSVGTKEIDGGLVFKFTDGPKYYFIKLHGGLEPQPDGKFETTVNIITVNK